MAYEIGGGSELSWWDEEERKRRERLGIAGAPISPRKAQETVESVWKGTPTRGDDGEIKLEQRSKRFYSTTAAEADNYLSTQFVSAVDGRKMGSLEEYSKLERNMGTDKLQDRIAAVTNICDSYLPNIDTSDVIWEMVKSPYDLSTITTMARTGALSDFVKQENRTVAQEKLAMNWFGNDQMIAKHYLAYGDQTVAPGKRLAAFATQNPVEALMLAASSLTPMAGAVPGVLGKIITAAAAFGTIGTGMTEYGSNKVASIKTAAEANRPMITTDTESPDFLKTLVIRPFLRDDDPLAKQFDELMAINSVVYNSELNDADLQALVEWLKTDLKDPYTGQILLPAQDIEKLESGQITYEVANALLERAADIRNQEFDYKYMLIESGYQDNPSADMDLPLSSDEWKPAMDKYNAHMIEEANAWEAYPLEAAFRDARGYEWTDAGRAAAREALNMLGPVNVPFAYGFDLINAYGGTQEALGARAEFVMRANQDATYKQAASELNEYIVARYMGEGNKYSTYDTWEPSHVSQVVNLVRTELMEKRGGLEEDAELIRLNSALAKEEMRLIAGDEGYFGKDYVATMARVFGANPEKWERLRKEHPEVVSATNLFIDVGAAFATPSMWKALKGGYAIGRDVPDFLVDHRVSSALSDATKHIDAGDTAAAARVLGDTADARDLVLSAQKWANAVNDGSAYRRVVDDVYAMAEKGDDAGVAKLFHGERAKEVAAKVGEFVRTKGTSERSLAYFERQVKPAEDAFGGTTGTITDSAKALLDTADANKLGLYTLAQIKKIARENKIKVTKSSTSTEIVAALREKLGESSGLVPKHLQSGSADPGVGVGFVPKGASKVLRETSETGQNWGPVPMPSAYSLREANIKKQLTNWLTNEQNKHGTIFGSKPVEDALKLQAALAWTTGKNILPEVGMSGLRGRNYTKIAIDSTIAKIKNDFLRKTLTGMTKWYHLEANKLVDPAGPDATEIIHDWVLLASGDAKVARDMAAESLRIKDAVGARAFEVKLQKMADIYLDRRKVARPLTQGGGGADSMMGLKPKPDATGKVLTYKTKDGELAQVPPDTAMTKYTVNLGSDVMWAPYKLPTVDADAALLVRGLQQTKLLSTKFRNTMRKGLKIAYNINSPLRNMAVGAGAVVLFQKHIVADTPRSWLAGVPVFNFRAVRKRTDNILTEVSAEAAEHVRYLRHRSEYTGQHYLQAVDGKWEEALLYDKSRNPRNIADTSDSLRRIGQSKVFKAWAKGGPDEARKWYGTAEGKKWLKDEGYYRAFRAQYGGPQLKGKVLDDAVADWAMKEYVTRYLEELRAAAPHILDGYADVPGLVKLSELGQMSKANMEKLIREVGKLEPSENIRLGIKRDIGAGGNVVNVATNPFIKAIDKAMIPDRFNRECVFNHTFNRLYTKWTKEGIDPDRAARSASEVAYARSEQVHFDMGRAMEFETKYRALVWFAADSRIYLQYWLKTVAERPTLAGVVTDFQSWMEERNKNLDLPEWQKYNVNISLGGGNYLSFDPKIYFWFTTYSAESMFGHAVERPAVWAINKLLGTDIKPAPMDFGFNITRFDELGKAAWHVLSSPLGARGFVPFKNVDDWNIPEAEWQEWMEKQAPAFRQKMSRETHKRMSLAELNGKPITWSEAVAQVLVSNLARQSYRFARPSSTRIITDEEMAYNALMKRIDDAKTPEEVSTILEQNPSMQYAMGMGTDPWVKDELDDYRAQYFAAQERLTAGLDRLFDEGRIMDKEAVDALFAERDLVRDTLKKESAVFSEWMTASNTEELEAALGYIMPETSAEFYMMKYAGPSDNYKAQVKAICEDNFKKALKQYGVMESEDSDPLYKMLKAYYVTKPMQLAGASYDTEYTNREQSIARYLGRGGEAGPMRADTYLKLVKENDLRKLVGKGIEEGKAAKDGLAMAYMSDADCEAIGWNRDPKAKEGWWQWAVQYHNYKKYTNENVAGSNTKGDTQAWAQFDKWVEQYKSENPGWAAEYEYSQLPLHKRLRMLGTGEGADAESQGWSGFLDLAEEYSEALGSVWNTSTKKYGISSGSKGAREVDEAYMQKLANYAREHEEWWRSFRATGWAISKFGWQQEMPGTFDDFLWETNPAEEE